MSMTQLRLAHELILLLLVAAGPTWAGSRPGAYAIEVYQIRQGLPDNTVNALSQTRDGYLWIATSRGLARFDGLNFTSFTKANTSELRHADCRALVEDADGNLWIGTSDGLLQLRDNRFEVLELPGKLAGPVMSLYPSRSGGPWLTVFTNYTRVTATGFTNYSKLHGPATRLSCVFEDRDGVLWLHANEGLMQVWAEKGRTNLVASWTGRTGQPASSFVQDPQGRVWFGNFFGLHCYDRGSIKTYKYTKPERLGFDRNPTVIKVLFASVAGDVWVTCGDHRRLHRFKDGDFIPVLSRTEKIVADANCGLEDREANLWVGTDEGLLRFRPRVMTLYGAEGLSADKSIASVCPGQNGRIWVGAKDGDVSFVSDGQLLPAPFETDSLFTLNCLLEDHSNVLWIAGALGKSPRPPAVLYRFSCRGLENVAPEFGLSNAPIRALYETRAGCLWIGTTQGLYSWKDGQRGYYGREQGLSGANIRALLEDRQGRLWIGTEGAGLNQFCNSKIRRFGESDGLQASTIYALHEDPEGAMWIGTDAGLYRCKDDQFRPIAGAQASSMPWANAILEDNAGQLWLGSEGEIVRVSRGDLNALLDGSTNRLHVLRYDQTDDLPSTLTTGEAQPSACRNAQGELWFATARGVVAIDPGKLKISEVPPPVLIEHVAADQEVIYGHSLDPDSKPLSPQYRRQYHRKSDQGSAKELRLPAGRAKVLEIHYTANSFIAPEKIRFKYRLSSHSGDEWIDAGNRRIAFFTGLGPGRHEFHVKACNSDGRWNVLGDTFAFTVAPYFYQTYWFYGAGGTVFLGLLFGLHRRRMSMLSRMHRLTHQNALERERTRIAQDMHDDLGATLSQVAILSEVVKKELHDPKAAMAHMERISASARLMVDNVTEIVWAISPRNDRLDNLCSYLREYAAQTFEDTEVHCTLEFPTEVPLHPVTAEIRRNLFLVLKEAARNVIKHSQASQVHVSLLMHTAALGLLGREGSMVRWLELVVADNGKGLGPPGPNSQGLQSMRDRIRRMNGTFHIEPNGLAGTRLRIRVPLPGMPLPEQSAPQQGSRA